MKKLRQRAGPVAIALGGFLLILVGVSSIFDGIRHRGVGYESVGEDHQYELKVSESRYRKDHYGQGAMLCIIGAVLAGTGISMWRNQDRVDREMEGIWATFDETKRRQLKEKPELFREDLYQWAIVNKRI
jgi:hypothetical protein